MRGEFRVEELAEVGETPNAEKGEKFIIGEALDGCKFEFSDVALAFGYSDKIIKQGVRKVSLLTKGSCQHNESGFIH